MAGPVSKNVAGQYVGYLCWNDATGAPKTGDVANHTVKICKDDGNFVAATNAPTEPAGQVDGGNCRLELSQAESNADFIMLEVTSSTDNVSIAPVHVHTTQLIPALIAYIDGSIAANGVDINSAIANQTLMAIELAAIRAKTDNLPSGVQKNVALSDFEFLMINSGNHISPKQGASVTGQISQNGGAFAVLTNTVSEVGSGVYKVDITAAEMNADVLTLKFIASGADQRTITIKTSS